MSADAYVFSMADVDSPVPQSLLSEEGQQRLLQQSFELWITPEVERRRAAGQLPEAFQLLSAQRLQWPNGRIEVRLNEEIRGIAAVRANRPVEKDDVALLSDFEQIEMFDLVEEELDCGHWTVLWTGKAWFIGFNFLSNRARCADLLRKASQFLQAAINARQLDHPAVIVDTMFSACELVAKAELVASHQVEIEAKSHGTIHSAINSWRKLGNVESAFVDLFNRLAQLRSRYRYDAEVSERMPIDEEDVTLVEAMIEAGLARVEQQRLRASGVE